MKLAGVRYTTTQLLIGNCVDALNLLFWCNTQDGQRNRNRPKSVIELMTKNQEDKVTSFRTAEDFELAREAILKRVGENNGN